MTPISIRRFAVFLRHMSLLDRVSVAILILYGCAYGVNRWSGRTVPLSALLGFFGVAAGAYLLVRVILLIRARGMWALRNRLIVAYFFMAVAPVVLLFAMVVVGAYLLELQIGAHLLRDDLDSRSAVIAADTNTIAAALTREPDLKPDQPVAPNSSAVVDPILLRPEIAKIIGAAQAETPGLRVYLNHGQQVVRELHGKQFSGLAEFRNQLWFSSAKSIPVRGGYATLLSVAPITPSVLDKLPSKLGPIGLTLLEPAPSSSGAGITLDGTHYSFGEQISSDTRVLAPATHPLDLHIDGYATLEAVRADLGPDNVEDLPVLAHFSLRLSEVNRDLLTSVGALGSFLVTVLGIVAGVFLLLEIAALAVGIMLTRTITASVAGLYEATLHVRRGDFSQRIQVRQKDQLGALADSFNEMTSSISELIEEQRQKQRLEHEVSIAHEVQQQLFPRVLPAVSGLELAAICRPARVVSGDYYDFIQLGPNRVGIAVADISGKGIYAALLMASLQAALRSIALSTGHGCTAEVISRVNTHLFVNTSDDRYATLFYAVYDSEAKTLTYTNAGHLGPLLVCPGGGDQVQQLEQGGTVVGLFEDPGYTERTVSVAPGSLLVAFSDGITEPENVYGEEFGIQRLRAEVLRHRDLPVNRLADNVIAAAEQWAGSPEQADDMTVVVARMG